MFSYLPPKKTKLWRNISARHSQNLAGMFEHYSVFAMQCLCVCACDAAVDGAVTSLDLIKDLMGGSQLLYRDV